MERIVITVDGLAGSGKSTLAKLLSEKLGYIHFNSGLIYRAIGYLALKNNTSASDANGVISLLDKYKIVLNTTDSITIGDLELSADELHLPEISEAASTVGSIPELRAKLVELQREAYKGKNLVAEGRDMGTVIFPNAQCKFFVVASSEIRTARRLKQLGYEVGQHAEDIEEIAEKIKKEILERDERDKNRAVAPTVAAEDAVEIDNSSKTLTEIIQFMYDVVAKKGLITEK